MAEAGGARDVLRRRDFRLLLTAQAVSILGDRMVAVALAFAVIELGGSATEVGLVLAAPAALMAASVLAGGVVADRLSRRSVMVAADVVRLATQGTMAALLVTGAAELWMLAALAGVTGAATGFFNPASTGVLPEVVPPEELQPANAVRWTAVSASEIAGPLIAGGLVVAAGPGWAIAVDAATFAVSAGCLLALDLPARTARAATSFVAELREGWSAFRARRWVWAFVLYFGFANMMYAAFSVLGPVIADRDLGGADAWGAVLGAMGAGALAGSLASTRIRPRRPLVVVAAAEALFGLPLGFLAAGVPVAALAVGAFLAGVGLTLGMTVWESTLQRNVPAESLSRVSSYDWFASFAFYPVGMVVWGPIAAGIGAGVTLWLAFALFMVAVSGLLSVGDVRRLRDTSR